MTDDHGVSEQTVNPASGQMSMPVIEAAGSPREIGLATGEAMREAIHAHLRLKPPRPEQFGSQRRKQVLRETLREHVPAALEELRATAEAADVAEDDLLYLNAVPQFGHVEPDRCSNVAFAGGPDGPMWGKNNDRPAKEGARPVFARVVRREEGPTVVVFTYAGLLATADGMNDAGLAVGHSSVGSVFEQSVRHVPIRLWAYEGLFRTNTTAGFVEHMQRLPLRGKGYAVICVDAGGEVASIEAPCPLVQVRRPARPHGHMQCVNVYQLPALAHADRRSPAGKENAKQRAEWLEARLEEDHAFDLGTMRSLLSRTDPPAICRRAVPPDESITEYSMIAQPARRRVLYLYGDPGRQEYQILDLAERAAAG